MADNELTLISPEGLDIACTYLENKSDTKLTAEVLGLPVAEVHRYLQKREVKAYIDNLYFESGFRNRDRMAAVMDEVIAQKLEEMDDTGMGSSKDILEILKEAHAMKMKEMEMEIKMTAAKKEASPAIAVQVNNNYNELLGKIMDAG